METVCTFYPSVTAWDVYDAYCESHAGMTNMLEDFLYELAHEFKGSLDDMYDKYVRKVELF